MRYSKYWIWLTLITAINYLHCTNTPVQTAGGSTGSEISGYAIDEQGMIIGQADVRLRPYTFLTVNSDVEQDKKDNSEVKTDDNGFFKISNVLPDSYFIEINYLDSIAVSCSFRISGADLHVVLPEMILSKMCSLSGVIEISDDTAASGVVRVFGLERYKEADNEGNFSIHLPYGIHTLRITALDLEDYDWLDVSVKVTQGEIEKNIGILKLNPVPLSPCSDYTCDSLTIVSILQETGLSSLSITDVTKNKNNRISELNLRGMGLSVLPKSINRLQALEVLDIGQNVLTSENLEINRLWNLKVLKVDHNKLARFPGAMTVVAGLKYINASYNLLSTLPESITSIRPDSLLNLSSNNLCGMDAEIVKWADTFNPGWDSTQVCP